MFVKNIFSEQLIEVHDKSPYFGDIVKCSNPERKLNDTYKVEYLGVKDGCGIPYGFFAARGIKNGGLYQFSVYDYETLK